MERYDKLIERLRQMRPEPENVDDSINSIMSSIGKSGIHEKSDLSDLKWKAFIIVRNSLAAASVLLVAWFGWQQWQINKEAESLKSSLISESFTNRSLNQASEVFSDRFQTMVNKQFDTYVAQSNWKKRQAMIPFPPPAIQFVGKAIQIMDDQDRTKAKYFKHIPGPNTMK